jgi:glycosyltransferase involved in cell wall biosynthesis
MNILLLSEVFYPHGSGGELATFLYSKLLSNAGNNLIVLTNRFAGEPSYSRDGRIQIYRVPIFSGGEHKYSTLLRLDVLATNYFRRFMKWADVVYIPKFWYSAVFVAKLYKKPVVIHSHGFLPICSLSYAYNVSKGEMCCNKMPLCSSCIYRYEMASGRPLMSSLCSCFLNNLVGSYFSQVIKLSDAVIAVSESQRSILVKNVPELRYKVHTIYNPLPTLSYTEIEADDFGYFGGPSVQKGFNLLCQALSYYQKRVNSSPLKVHSTCFNMIDTKFVEQLELRGIIAYGKVDEVSYNKIYRKIRAVVVPSVWPEVYGYVASEAFLRGRLVIASSIGGLPEVTAGCSGAFTFQSGNYLELAKQFEIVKSLSRERAINLGVQNREVILKKFSNEHILEQFVNLFDSLVD